MYAVSSDQSIGFVCGAVLKMYRNGVAIPVESDGPLAGTQLPGRQFACQDFVQVCTVDRKIVHTVFRPYMPGVGMRNCLSPVVEDGESREQAPALDDLFCYIEFTKTLHGIGCQLNTGAQGPEFRRRFEHGRADAYSLQGNGGCQTAYASAEDGDCFCSHRLYSAIGTSACD
jgi:hypothetical protein